LFPYIYISNIILHQLFVDFILEANKNMTKNIKNLLKSVTKKYFFNGVILIYLDFLLQIKNNHESKYQKNKRNLRVIL